MSDSNQTAARLAQVARRLEGSGSGFTNPPSTSQSTSGPLIDGLPCEPTLVTLIDCDTNRAYHAVETDDGSVALELSDVLADETWRRATSGAVLDGGNHPTQFFFRRHERDGTFFGLTHPPTGRFLQAKKQGMRRLQFFSRNFGVNEQFEAVDLSESNHNAKYNAGVGRDATFATLTLRPRRFPNVQLRVRLCNAVASSRAPNPFEQKVLTGAAMPSNLGAFGSKHSSAPSSGRETPRITSAPQSPLPSVPTHRPSGRPPAHESRAGSTATSTYTTPTVSPNTFAIRQSWRSALSLATSSKQPSLPGSAAKQGRYGRDNSVYSSVMSTPGGVYNIGQTPGGGFAVGDVHEEDALDLGVRLMSKFARSSAMGGSRRYLRQVFSAWRRHHDLLKKHAGRVVALAGLMRRAIQRRNLKKWHAVVSKKSDERNEVERLKRVKQARYCVSERGRRC